MFKSNSYDSQSTKPTKPYEHSLTRVPGLPGDFAATKKLQEW